MIYQKKKKYQQLLKFHMLQDLILKSESFEMHNIYNKQKKFQA